MAIPSGIAERILNEVLDLDLLIASLQERIKSRQKVKYERLKQLAQEIQAGNSTNDPVVDFVALHFGLIKDQDIADGPVVQYVWELSDSCSRAQYKPALVVRREVKIDDFRPHYFSESCGSTEDGLRVSGLVPPPTFRFVNYLVNFGVLSDPELFFDLEDKEAYLVSGSWSMIDSSDNLVKPALIRAHGDGSQELVLPPLANLIAAKSNPDCSPHWSVVVGCQAVKDWISDCEDFRIHDALSKWFELHFDAKEEPEPEKGYYYFPAD